MKKKKSSPPLPLPRLPPPTHRRKSISTSSSSFSSSNSSTSSTLPSPSLSPSPYHHPSSVPFSWERKPGVPFTPLHPHYPPSHSLPLPLPPSKFNQKGGRDRDSLVTNIRRRRKALEIVFALIQRLSTLDPYGSCKSVAKADVVSGEGSKKICVSRMNRR